MLIKQDDGTEIEVLTQEEVNEKVKEELEKYQKENPTTAELEALKADLAAKEAELEKANGKETNFSALRKQKEAAEQKLSEFEQTFKKEIAEIKGGLSNKDLEEKAKQLARGDVELQKKILFHYNRIKDEVKSDEDISKKMADAYILSTGGVNMIDRVGGSRGAPIYNNVKAADITPEAREVGAKLGVTEEDIKKAEEFTKNKK